MLVDNKLFNINSTTYITNITKDSIVYIISRIFNILKSKIILYVVNINQDIDLVENQILFYLPNIKIIKFYEWDTIPYDINSPNIKIQTERMKSIYNLINFHSSYEKEKILILATEKSLYQKVINKNDYKYIQLQINQNILINDFIKKLEENGFNKVDTSKNIGNYSINNNTIDFINFDNIAYRIYIKNNILKEINIFDIKTQLNERNIDNILILPIKEIILNEENIENFKKKYIELFEYSKLNDVYNNIINRVYDGIENWLPLFYRNNLQNIFEYLPENTIFIYKRDFNRNIFNTIKEMYEIRLKNDRLYNPINPNLLFIDFNQIEENFKKHINIIFDIDNKQNNSIDLKIKAIPSIFNEKQEIFQNLKKYLDR